MERNDGEHFVHWSKRVTDALFDNTINLEQWSAYLFGEMPYTHETMRRASLIFKKWLTQMDAAEIDGMIASSGDKEAELRKLLAELKAEKIKVQTLNLEHRANDREDARRSLFYEEIENAVMRLPEISFSPAYHKDYPSVADGVLCIADAHNGVEINMKSLFGEVVNVYNPEILRARLTKLLSGVISDKERYFDYGHLTVFDLGDAIQNILRLSDIAKLRTGVLDSALDYAEMISQWLVALSDGLEVPIEYIPLGGNHAELRLVNSKHGDFENENLGKVIREFVALRLKGNPNITVAPYAECGFKEVQGINILAYHGDDAKSTDKEIAFWEQYHQIDIDMLIMGHLHHKDESGVGYALNGGDKEVVYVPSLVGADSFSKRCRKLSRAGAKFMLFEDGAKTFERTYILN